MKRKDEEFAKNALHGFLLMHHDASKISWREVDLANEPPDYFVQMESREFAVEVTGILDVAEIGQTRSIRPTDRQPQTANNPRQRSGEVTRLGNGESIVAAR